MMPWLERTELLLGSENVEKLQNANVLVVGVGGVGAYAAEMIARAGVGKMTLADADIVSESNINRQLIALHSTVGREKCAVLAERLRDINPALELTCVPRFIDESSVDSLLDSAEFDYAVDAIDTLSPKIALIKGTLDRGIPLVSSMGSGGKMDPAALEIADIAKTHHCPLARVVRGRLHKLGIDRGFTAVFSAEPVREGSVIQCDEQNKRSNLGTISYTPAMFGIGCASVVIRGLIGEFPEK
ncbi:MAG: tRNA threonylcarbamoyladenosine dehydratase [Methanocorpusculum sp.]|nr:tRNA threonylcarbamoyladenosine dehydratase [Methanocorpusculum sp.]